jgi:hypothetical protein
MHCDADIGAEMHRPKLLVPRKSIWLVCACNGSKRDLDMFSK